MIDREEGGPNTEEHQHAESHELGFTECVRQVSGQVSHSVAPECHGAVVSQDRMEGNSGSLVAYNNYVAMFRGII